jgi:SAM-dependent methyltransferase
MTILTAPPADIDALRWYHTIRLPDGRVTPGLFDTLAECRHVPLPESLTGKRCLDVGTADGFWAFEMEARGAAEVVAIDVDDPAGYDWPGQADPGQRAAFEQNHPNHRRAFELVHGLRESSVKRIDMRVSDLPDADLGRFDFAFMGSLLLHLRDPVGALQSIGQVLDGTLLSVDAISPLLTLMHPVQPIARLEAPGWPLWWVMNLAAYRRLFPAAGFDVESTGRPFAVRPGGVKDPDQPRAGGRPWRVAQERVRRRVGIPHAWVLARPGVR